MKCLPLLLVSALLVIGCSKSADDVAAPTGKDPVAAKPVALTEDQYMAKMSDALGGAEAAGNAAMGGPDPYQHVLPLMQHQVSEIRALQPPAADVSVHEAILKFVDVTTSAFQLLADAEKKGDKASIQQALTEMGQKAVGAQEELTKVLKDNGFDTVAFFGHPSRLAKAAAAPSAAAPSGDAKADDPKENVPPSGDTKGSAPDVPADKGGN